MLVVVCLWPVPVPADRCVSGMGWVDPGPGWPHYCEPLALRQPSLHATFQGSAPSPVRGPFRRQGSWCCDSLSDWNPFLTLSGPQFPLLFHSRFALDQVSANYSPWAKVTTAFF